MLFVSGRNRVPLPAARRKPFTAASLCAVSLAAERPRFFQAQAVSMMSSRSECLRIPTQFRNQASWGSHRVPQDLPHGRRLHELES